MTNQQNGREISIYGQKIIYFLSIPIAPDEQKDKETVNVKKFQEDNWQNHPIIWSQTKYTIKSGWHQNSFIVFHSIITSVILSLPGYILDD